MARGTNPHFKPAPNFPPNPDFATDEVEEIYDTMDGREGDDDDDDYENNLYDNTEPQNQYEDVIIRDYQTDASNSRTGFHRPQTADELYI